MRLCRERVFLTNRLIAYKQHLVQGDNSFGEKIAALEFQLKALALQELEGSKIRSRAQWLEEGEKPTRYFFRVEVASAPLTFLGKAGFCPDF